MNFRATSEVKFVDLSRVMQRIVPALVDSVEEGCEAVVAEAQTIVPVDTGALKESIHTASVELVGSTVQGHVVADEPYAAFVRVRYRATRSGIAGSGSGSVLSIVARSDGAAVYASGARHGETSDTRRIRQAGTHGILIRESGTVSPAAGPGS